MLLLNVLPVMMTAPNAKMAPALRTARLPLNVLFETVTPPLA